MTTGFAIVYDKKIAYTSAPEIIGEGSIYQIYRTEEEAQKFVEKYFPTTGYDIRPVVIFDIDDVHTEEAKDVEND